MKSTKWSQSKDCRKWVEVSAMNIPRVSGGQEGAMRGGARLRVGMVKRMGSQGMGGHSDKLTRAGRCPMYQEEAFSARGASWVANSVSALLLEMMSGQ